MKLFIWFMRWKKRLGVWKQLFKQLSCFFFAVGLGVVHFLNWPILL
jgi:hypothetical protein